MGYYQEWVISLKGSVVLSWEKSSILWEILPCVTCMKFDCLHQVWIYTFTVTRCLWGLYYFQNALYSFTLAGNAVTTHKGLKYQYFDIFLSLLQQHTEIGLWNSMKWISVYFIFQITWIIDHSISLLLSFSELCG